MCLSLRKIIVINLSKRAFYFKVRNIVVIFKNYTVWTKFTAENVLYVQILSQCGVTN